MVMNKLKTLLGAGNAVTILVSLIKYSILCVMFRFMNPWVVSSIWLVVAAFISFYMLCCIKEEEGLSAMLVGILCFCLPIAVLQAVLYYYTFKYIGWFGIPALTIANLLMWMFITDDEDEPRTKTISSNETNREEVEGYDEDDPVAGPAQDVPACGDGPDPDGDPEDEKLKQYSGRYDWNTGEPIKRTEAE